MNGAETPKVDQTGPLVDVVIAVHQPSRPVERAVGSVLDGSFQRVRVTVVVHNTETAPVRDRLSRYLSDPRLRLEELHDGIPSPAGPMNLGLALATAPYAALLGSDDEFEPGALSDWLDQGLRNDADMVIAPVRKAGGTFEPTPPVRASRWSDLDGAKDRLAYRAAPLGLIGRNRFGHLRLLEGVVTGEDQPFSTAIWYSTGARIVFPIASACYLVHDDQADRVTFAPKPVGDEFAALLTMLDSPAPWMSDGRARLSFLTKVVRVHLFDAVRARLTHAWDPTQMIELARVAREIASAEPRVRTVLSRVDAQLFAAISDGRLSRGEAARLVAARGNLRSFGTLVTHRLRHVLHPQGPLRFHLAGRRLASVRRRAHHQE